MAHYKYFFILFYCCTNLIALDTLSVTNKLINHGTTRWQQATHLNQEIQHLKLEHLDLEKQETLTLANLNLKSTVGTIYDDLAELAIRLQTQTTRREEKSRIQILLQDKLNALHNISRFITIPSCVTPHNPDPNVMEVDQPLASNLVAAEWEILTLLTNLGIYPLHLAVQQSGYRTWAYFSTLEKQLKQIQVLKAIISNHIQQKQHELTYTLGIMQTLCSQLNIYTQGN